MCNWAFAYLQTFGFCGSFVLNPLTITLCGAIRFAEKIYI